jgi:hypothetical protein
MSFDKELLKKIANDVRESGVTSSKGGELLKKASDIKIAYLSAVIKKPYQ